MSTTTTHKIDDEKCRFFINILLLFNESIYPGQLNNKEILIYLDAEIDLITTTLSPIIANICQNQTTSSSDEIENRINVVVPYLVVLGKYFLS
jgi:hypothetical protein